MTRRFILGWFAAVSLVMAACSAAPSASGPPTLEPLQAMTLGAEGIGPVVIGDPPADVIAEVTSRFGGFDTDSGWIDPDSDVYGSCPGTELRAVAWGSLVLFFSNTTFAPQDRFFSSWTYGFDHESGFGGVDPRGLGLTTAEGIGIGSTRTDLRAAYGERLREITDEDIGLWSFVVDAAEPRHLEGRLSGADDDASVTVIESVPGCGPRA